MTIGIYALFWESTGQVYIGLSTCISKRFYSHINLMQKGTHENYKIQEVYLKLGLPSLHIIEECSVHDLAEKEIYWINEFNSINEGLNISEGGYSSWGPNHTTAKYSKFTILRAFSLLSRPNLTLSAIESKTGVKKALLSHICTGRAHTWLSRYADTYKLVTRCRDKESRTSRSTSMTNNGSKKYYYKIIDPSGKEYTTTCISKFCRECGEFNNAKTAQQGFSKVINNHVLDYHGWRIEKVKNGL